MAAMAIGLAGLFMLGMLCLFTGYIGTCMYERELLSLRDMDAEDILFMSLNGALGVAMIALLGTLTYGFGSALMAGMQ